MDVSVLIATRENAMRLKQTLDAFPELIIPHGLRWELIIVNNNCTDNTDDVVNEFSSILPISYLKEPLQGTSRARNRGLMGAKGNLVIFTDDDVKPCADWIKIYWQAYNDNSAEYFFGGPIESIFEAGKPDEDLLSAAPYSVRGLDFGKFKKVISNEESFINANWSAPLRAIKQAGAFDIELGLGASPTKLTTGGETDLMYKLRSIGLAGLYLPEARLQHYVPKQKCTLEHILARREAGALHRYIRFGYKGSNIRLFKRPIILYIRFLWHGCCYIYNRMISTRYVSAYINMRADLTAIRAFVEVQELEQSKVDKDKS